MCERIYKILDRSRRLQAKNESSLQQKLVRNKPDKDKKGYITNPSYYTYKNLTILILLFTVYHTICSFISRGAHARTRKTCARAPISTKTRLLANEELEGHVLISWRSAARAPANMADRHSLSTILVLIRFEWLLWIYCEHKGINLMETLVSHL